MTAISSTCFDAVSRLTSIAPLLLALIVVYGCDRTESKETPEEPAPIAAAPSYRPLPPGTTFRATISATARLPEKPSKRERKETGRVRPLETTTTVESTFYAEVLEHRGKREKWRVDFESFEKVRQRSGSPKAATTHSLPDRAFIVESGPDGTEVTNKDGDPVTESQQQFVTAIVTGIQNRAAWSEFLATRKFEQGKIVEAKSGLLLGGFAEAFFGEARESNTTVSLFRLGLSGGNEVAHFDVHSRMKLDGRDDQAEDYLDLEEDGRAVVRIVDAFVVEYETKAKVTPRAADGKMLPIGSGSWELRFAVDADTLRTAD